MLAIEPMSNETLAGNQIYLVTLRSRQITQASFLQKNQTLQNVFLISVTLRWHRASVVCKNQSFKVDHFTLPLFFFAKIEVSGTK